MIRDVYRVSRPALVTAGIGNLVTTAILYGNLHIGYPLNTIPYGFEVAVGLALITAVLAYLSVLLGFLVVLYRSLVGDSQ